MSYFKRLVMIVCVVLAMFTVFSCPDTEVTYIITFDSNGGSGNVPGVQKVKDGFDITLPGDKGLSKTGFIFDGWNTKADGTGIHYYAYVSFTPTETITLYAIWGVPVERIVENFTFRGASTFTLVSYNGFGGQVTIPAEVDGKPVIAIGSDSRNTNGVFQNKNISSVTIPSSVIYIGTAAFKENRLYNIIIPNSVTTIGNSAFENSQLASVTISSGVSSIGEAAFKDNHLTSVYINKGIIGDSAFESNRLTNVSIGDGVSFIGEAAFMRNNLRSVIIGYGVTMIGKYAFYGSTLTSIIIPHKVNTIGYSAFQGHPLTSITVGSYVNLNSAFANGFERAYNNAGKSAGTYTRPDSKSMVWTKK